MSFHYSSSIKYKYPYCLVTSHFPSCQNPFFFVIFLFFFKCMVTDANGKQVLSVRADEGGMNGVYSSDDLKDLWELEPGETGIVRWSAEELKDAKGEYKFEITSYAK